jgi:aldose 1-epimerase
VAQITAFGTTADGRAVDKITLAAGDLTVCLLTWGAVVQSVRLAGVGHDLTLGSERLADYQGEMRYHGAILAPVANRIGQARAQIGGQEHRFEPNQGAHCLHSGSTGAHQQIWQLITASDSAATLALDLPDGLGGFPGNRRIEARFSLTGATLRLELHATTDAETLWNATNHSYWNLDGSPDFTGHSLQIAAEHWLPTDADARPTGEIAPVAGSAMDFRQPRKLTPGAPPLDHNFCLSGGQMPLREVLHLQGKSGVSLRLATTEPGVQIYDSRGAARPYDGLAIETQVWPDAPSYPAFPQISLRPGETRMQITEWRFART